MLRTKPRRGSLRRDALKNAMICLNDMEGAIEVRGMDGVSTSGRQTQKTGQTHTHTVTYKYFRTPAVLRGAGGADVRTYESKQVVA